MLRDLRMMTWCNFISKAAVEFDDFRFTNDQLIVAHIFSEDVCLLFSLFSMFLFMKGFWNIWGSRRSIVSSLNCFPKKFHSQKFLFVEQREKTFDNFSFNQQFDVDSSLVCSSFELVSIKFIYEWIKII